MKYTALISILVLSLGMPMAASASKSQQQLVDKSLIVNLDEKVDDKFLHEYANIWWQWAESMSREYSPVVDTVGEFCDVNQQGDVWFLASGYGNSLISRHCVIPADKHIFFPVINMAFWPNLKAETKSTCQSVKQGAALNNDELLTINVTIDGKSVDKPERFRLKSEKCFDLLGMVDRKYNPPILYPAASDGYWIMMRPLSKGHHKITFSAQYFREGIAYGKMAQDISYELDVQ